jgi:hypothetical protein
MPSLLIKCPTTQKLIPTGIAADKSSFESGQFSNNSVKCAACGQIHTWNKQDVAPETWRSN